MFYERTHAHKTTHKTTHTSTSITYPYMFALSSVVGSTPQRRNTRTDEHSTPGESTMDVTTPTGKRKQVSGIDTHVRRQKKNRSQNFVFGGWRIKMRFYIYFEASYTTHRHPQGTALHTYGIHDEHRTTWDKIHRFAGNTLV